MNTDTDPPQVDDPYLAVTAELLFPSEAAPGSGYEDCPFSSPLLYLRDGQEEIILNVGEWIHAHDAITGQELWRVQLPAPEGQRAVTAAPPGRSENLLIVGYYTTAREIDPAAGRAPRLRQMVAVIDLAAKNIATEFTPLELGGEFASSDGSRVVSFRPKHAFGRGEIVVASSDGNPGKAYVTFGNVQDIQPWHGFAFEVDLEQWRDQGPDAAITGRLVTTPEPDCGPSGASGSRERICGGGLWSPSGPLLVPDRTSFDLILPTGNGQLDIPREDYANTLMRVGEGLSFDPGCDAAACDDFNPDFPSPECVDSCENLFVPRRIPEDGALRPESGVCDDTDSMFECWQRLDYIGGSTPTLIELPSGRRGLVYPTKDGAVYLVDFAHLGTMWDRLQLVPVCGTADQACLWDWAGMIVTQPALANNNGTPLLLIPTFMPDGAHPAGVVAVRVTDGEVPGLEVVWQAPNFSTDESVRRFREHPSRPAIQTFDDGLQFAWVVEALRGQPQGQLLGIRVWDGQIVEDVALAGPGSRFTKPLIVDDRLYVPSCGIDRDSGFLEGYRILKR